jgi:hypothetical protein
MDMKRILWKDEFSEGYRPDDCILGLLLDDRVSDNSWHNDACPHFSAPAGDGQNVELWFEHPDPTERETPNEGYRYFVLLRNMEDDSVAPESLETDDGELAALTFRGLMAPSRELSQP